MAALWVAGGTISVQEPGPTQSHAAQESAAQKAPTVRGEVPRRQRQLDDRAPLPGKARCSLLPTARLTRPLSRAGTGPPSGWCTSWQ